LQGKVLAFGVSNGFLSGQDTGANGYLFAQKTVLPALDIPTMPVSVSIRS
jgi:hypothetical protein